MEWEALLKIFLAMLLGGIIGIEREIGNRPAGFRTHTLVCMGSALVMLTSDYMLKAYSNISIPDPARLGAQVISGIGFLGAGTILKDGSRVRGLTTAASIWVVACIGIAIGVGFYWGAIIASVFSYITLFLLKKIELVLTANANNHDLRVEFINKPGQIAKITDVLEVLKVVVKDIKVIPGEGEWSAAHLNIKIPQGVKVKTILAELRMLDNVIIYEEVD
ncbi:MAG: MgtC/SapB family protein [Caldicoprobacterales bacterium]|jgi:putative Mg2+ transporter-C (MgtC) family protein|nr:MgtC/SapB family protein [Clostridia bacterium]MDI9513012.1 MgtC/SapB family protein [Bacillota bacterium]NLH58673.1 MgtC/SapB family protein [Clostridiales bacterium]